jgi:ATP-binding cassette subfamily F protein uup
LGSLSDYAECLVEQEKYDEASSGSGSVDSETKKASYKEDKEKRLERRNAIKKLKRELGKIEPALDKLKVRVVELQAQIDKSANEGWTLLADLSQQVEKVEEEIEAKEVEWLDLAEALEKLEEEEKVEAS